MENFQILLHNQQKTMHNQQKMMQWIVNRQNRHEKRVDKKLKQQQHTLPRLVESTEEMNPNVAASKQLRQSLVPYSDSSDSSIHAIFCNVNYGPSVAQADADFSI